LEELITKEFIHERTAIGNESNLARGLQCKDLKVSILALN
jgi:hypothetical protein